MVICPIKEQFLLGDLCTKKKNLYYILTLDMNILKRVLCFCLQKIIILVTVLGVFLSGMNMEKMLCQN